MTDKSPRILFLAHDPQIPSFRLRLKPAAEALERMGADVRIERLRRGREVLRLLPLLKLIRRADLVVVSKLKFFGPERSLVRKFSGPWVYDVDDAVMFGKPKFHGQPPDRARWRLKRFEAMCRGASLVVTATRILAERVPRDLSVEVIPTPVPCAGYPVRMHERKSGELVLAWIGLGENLRYLNDLIPILNEASGRIPGLRLDVISDGLPEGRPAFPMCLVPWSEETQGASLAASDIGLAPLPDDLWTTGKGGFKMIQYMAAGLPVLASRLQAQAEIGGPEGGAVYYCSTPEEWKAALMRLSGDMELRSRMGASARGRAQELFDVGVVSKRYAELILDLARDISRTGPRG